MLGFRRYPGECGFSANTTVATAENKSVSATQPGGDFMEQSRSLAKKESITVIAAMQRLEKTNPALREAYIAQGIAKKEADIAAAQAERREKSATVDFMSVSRDRAAKDKISMTEAMRLTYKENPTLHAKFIEDAIAKRQVRHYTKVSRCESILVTA